MRKTDASRSSPPRRSRTSSAASWDRRSAARGATSASSSPISAVALATSRMRCMSRFARGAPRRSAGAACASTARARRRLSPTACATPSASTSPRGCAATGRSLRARWSASPIRVPTPRTDTSSSPRRWARLPSTIPVTTWSATRGRCSPTAPPRAPCADTACRRRRLPTSRTSTSARRPSAWIRWPSGCRI